MNPAAPAKPRLSALDALRGIAALGVCWFHFTHGNPHFLPEGWLKPPGLDAWLRVEIFFVLSGFVIPYTLWRAGYRVADYGLFLLKRLSRLEPPYLATVLLVIGLGYLSSAMPGFRGKPFEFSLPQTAAHLGYLNAIAGYSWLNPVFWTLAIEFQFYLFMGLFHPFVSHVQTPVRMLAFGGLAALCLLVPDRVFLFHWLPVFMLGMVAFQFRAGLIQRPVLGLWLTALGLGAWQIYGGPLALVAVLTAWGIAEVQTEVKNPVILFFGRISYSLYLVHVPVGGRIINLGERYVPSLGGKIMVLGLAWIVSVAAAWVLYQCVERPVHQWASRLRYRRVGENSPAAVVTQTSPS